jgi:uncharacterized protein (TIGR03437 family)
MRTNAALLFLAVTGLAVAQPSISSGGIVNGASFLNGSPVAQGSLISIFGSQLAAGIAAADTIPLTTSLGGVTVKFVNGSTAIDAPLLYMQQNQINAQVPWNLLPGESSATLDVVVTNNGVSSAPQQVKVGPFSPGIFAIGHLAAVQNLDGSFAQPAGTIPGRTSRPAKVGDTVVIYATGLGPVDSPMANGDIPPAGKLIHTIHHQSVLFGGHSAMVEFAGLSPQFVGVYQLNVVVPDTSPIGDNVPIQLVLGGIGTSSSITVAVTR